MQVGLTQEDMRTFVYLTSLICLSCMTPCYAQYSRTLTTENYVAVITVNCVEGTVACANVDYLGTNRETGQSIRLHGRDLIHYCRGDQGDGPGKTPCRHEGYVFKNGTVVYRIWDRGVLEVLKHIGERLPDGSWPSKRLLRELGEWSK